MFMRNEVGRRLIEVSYAYTIYRDGGWINTQGFMLEYVVDGKALGLTIASRYITIDGYIVKAPQRLRLTLFRNIKTA